MSREPAIAILVLFAAARLRAQPTQPGGLLKAVVPPADRQASYGSDASQFGELRVPPGDGLYPVAILVHGGCWSVRVGNYSDEVTSLRLLRPLAAALRDAGVATWNVEYRRVGNAGGGWPGTYQDLARAADFLAELAPKHHLNLKQVIAIGHSSGGQLALWLAARRKLPKTSVLYSTSPLRLIGVLDLDGPPDLAAARSIEQKVCGTPAITRFLGGTPDEFPERYAEGSAATWLPLHLRQELLFASQPEEWAALPRAYEAAARRARDPVRLTLLDNTGHFDWLDPKSPAWKPVIESVRSLLLLNDR